MGGWGGPLTATGNDLGMHGYGEGGGGLNLCVTDTPQGVTD